ncbi:GNAT family N-acetyltransferase [Clostridium minihomine]|uniref:GNAT family N-acetyltransferase n=1 Tax=Clostridium minihomine TaxID=2045012 RepID=UPI000C771082|nr:GNAT family N-acetyltransferase [Clostridium minihomine]
MSKKIIRLARWGMQAELAQIWQICFEESKRPTYYFFNNAFQPQNCLVYQIDGKAAAMVHMLPVQMVQAGGTVQGHYIYVASTLPEYQKQGCMGALLRAAAHVGEKRGDHFSCLLPSSDALYDYYSKYGYEEAFVTRFLTVSAQELSQLGGKAQWGQVVLGYSRMKALREQQLNTLAGSILWDEKAFRYAEGINGQYGGKLVASGKDGQGAYALCRYLDGEVCEVTELMADEISFPALAAQMLAKMPAQQYRLRLPDNGVLFPGQGQVQRFGMLRQISAVQCGETAYLGLPLD